MGHRVELYVDESVADDIIRISRSFDVDAQVIGRVEASGRAQVTIRKDGADIRYTK